MITHNRFQFLLIFIFVFYLTKAGAIVPLTDEEHLKLPKVFQLDNFDDCLAGFENPLYCSLNIYLQPKNLSNPSDVWNLINKSIEIPRYFRHDNLRYGICVPSKCPKALKTYLKLGRATEDFLKELGICLSKDFKYADLEGLPTVEHCHTSYNNYPITTYHMIFGGIVIMLLILAFLGSYWERRLKTKSEEEYNLHTSTKLGRILSSFSVPRNFEKLTKPNSDFPELKAFTGVRAVGICITIASHTILANSAIPISNTRFLEDLTVDPANIFLTNAYCIIQIFFVMSGWLLCFQLFNSTKNVKTVRFSKAILIFINRYVRLFGAVIFLVAFNSTWLINLADGPVWNRMVGEEYRNCRKNGWSNVLFVNNYYNKEEMCMPHGWYVATDTQLFIVSVFIVLLMRRYEKQALKIATFSVIFSLVLPIVVNYLLDSDIILRCYPETLYGIFILERNFHILHTSTHVNFAGYTIGITAGYLFYTYRGKEFPNNKLTTFVWWIVSFIIPISTVLVGGMLYRDDIEPTRLQSAFYSGLYRPIFALGMAIAFYGFTVKKGGGLRRFLEWDGFLPFARVSYCAYLVHTIPVRIRAGIIRNPGYISNYTFVIGAISDIVLSYFLGFLLTLLVEMPISSLSKMVMSKNSKSDANLVEEKNSEGKKDIGLVNAAMEPK